MHEPSRKEMLVEALFAALASEPPEDLDLFGHEDAVRATIGGVRFRIDLSGGVEEADGGVLSAGAASRSLETRIRPALDAVARRLWSAARPGGPIR